MTNRQLLQLKKRYIAEGYKMALKERVKDNFGEEWEDQHPDFESMNSLRQEAQSLSVAAEHLKASIEKDGNAYSKRAVFDYIKQIKTCIKYMNKHLKTLGFEEI